MALIDVAKKLADYLAGSRTYIVCILLFLYTLWHDRGHYDGNTLINLGFDAVLASLRAVTWRPGGLSGAVTLEQPDGGTLVVKAPPVANP